MSGLAEQDRGAPPRALPEWLVSSPHARRPPHPDDRAPRPYGLHHARRVGSPYTACGLPAQGWPFFWDLPFGRDLTSSCPACVDAIRRLSTAG